MNHWPLFFEISAATAALAAIILAWWALRRYLRTQDGVSKFTLFGLLAFAGPWLAAIVVAINGLQMKSPEFCNSCHTMNGHYDDLQDPHSDGLASRHFQNNWVPKEACFSCHTEYGAFGGVKAKVNGMHHVYRQYIGKREGELKLYRPYDNRNCLTCHGGNNRRYKAEPSHLDNEAEILANDTSCLECHSPVHNAGEAAAPAKDLIKKVPAKEAKGGKVARKS